MGFLIRNLQTCKLQLSALRDFKTHEITSTVELPSSEAGTNGCSKQQLKPSVLEKDLFIDVLKIKTSKDKIKFF